MGAYVAIINIPGYLPDTVEPPPAFETAREAWNYLREEIERGELAYEPANERGYDPDGPQQLTAAALSLEEERDRIVPTEGTVYGPSYIPEPDEDTSTDLGLAYSVIWDDDAEVDKS